MAKESDAREKREPEELDHTEIFRRGPVPPWELRKNAERSWLSR